MKRRDFTLLIAAGALTGVAPVGAAGFDIEGKYERIRPAQPTETPEGVVEVLDVFGYRCPHCFNFLPVLEQYEREIPGYAAVRHMPVIFRESWRMPARAFYTAKLLGVLDELHRPIFEALHVERRPMTDVASWRELFAARGVDPDEFDKTFGSFAVESLLRKSEVMQGRYGIAATPTIVVNGKYRIAAGLAGSFDNLIAITEALVERERA